jgi:hypothetical protein
MRLNTHNYTLTAASAVAAFLVLCPALRANQTITITSSPYTYVAQGGQSESVGPYTANIVVGPTGLLVFCLDGNINGANGPGNLDTFSSIAPSQSVALDKSEEEAAFLASYSLYLDPLHNKINADEGPIQLAIWYIMGTLPTGVTVSATQNAAAWAYATQAQNIVTNNPSLFLATSTFMSTVSVWIPTTGTQRFVTVGSLTPQILNATPEPGTVVFLGTGVLLLALSRIRRRR